MALVILEIWDNGNGMAGELKNFGNLPRWRIGPGWTNHKLVHRRIGEIVIHAKFVKRDLVFFQVLPEQSRCLFGNWVALSNWTHNVISILMAIDWTGLLAQTLGTLVSITAFLLVALHPQRVANARTVARVVTATKDAVDWSSMVVLR
jgi:hypothetical protein